MAYQVRSNNHEVSLSQLFQRSFYSGSLLNWSELQEELRIGPISPDALQQYFDPLLEWLKKENKGREITLAKWGADEDQ